MTELSYQAIYWFSKVQMGISQMIKKWTPKTTDTPFFSHQKMMLGNSSEFPGGKSFDLILVEVPNEKTNCLDVIVSYDRNELNRKNDFDVSNIAFIFAEFRIKDKPFKIVLKSATRNYFVVGNKFTREFFISHVTGGEIRHDTSYDDCSLFIIDHMVKTVEIKFTDKEEYILVEKNGYQILNKN